MTCASVSVHAATQSSPPEGNLLHLLHDTPRTVKMLLPSPAASLVANFRCRVRMRVGGVPLSLSEGMGRLLRVCEVLDHR
jgi:hypothetical protein